MIEIAPERRKVAVQQSVTKDSLSTNSVGRTTMKRTKTTTKTNGLTFLSIDPGCRHTGWSINTIVPSGKIRVISHGVFEHDFDPEANARFFKSVISSNYIVLIEDPPVIRVNASTSHILGKIFGAILGVVAISDIISYETIPPKSWQHSLLRNEYKIAKEGGSKISTKEKDEFLKNLVNANITRRKPIVSPHVIDTIGMVLYYCKRNGTNIEDIKMKDLMLASTKTKKISRRVKRSARKKPKVTSAKVKRDSYNTPESIW